MIMITKTFSPSGQSNSRGQSMVRRVVMLMVGMIVGLPFLGIEGEGIEEGPLVPGDLSSVAGEAAGCLSSGGHEDQSLSTKRSFQDIQKRISG